MSTIAWHESFLGSLIELLGDLDIFCSSVLDRVPVEIWLRIISELALDDIQYAELALTRTAERSFFPHIKPLTLVNRAFHNAANHMKNYIVVVRNAADAAAFTKKSRDGLPTRLLSLTVLTEAEYWTDVLSAARGVTHLVLDPLSFESADLLIPELKGECRSSVKNPSWTSKLQTSRRFTWSKQIYFVKTNSQSRHSLCPLPWTTSVPSSTGMKIPPMLLSSRLY